MKFDYIIAGGGTAGCVLANRLSEDPQNKVLLIEAGPRGHHPLIRVPAAFSELFKSGLDWKDETVPQPGLSGQRMYSPRGRVLGGCSSMNAMIFLRPHPSDMKRWNQPGWSWEECLPLLQQVEQQFGFYHEEGEAYSREPFYQHPLTDRFLEAAYHCGFNRGLQNSTVQSAAFPFLKNIHRGRRYSAVDAYLRPAIKRPNLTVLTGALIDRFEIRDGEIKHARILHQKQIKHFTATRSYVLAAGTFQSPAILQRSGAGPSDLLDRLGIRPLLTNDQIGANLQDHLICGFAYRVNPNQSLDALQQWTPRLRELWRWIAGQQNMLSSN
ncbi:MAG TPA: GMC family oxidoreductase N-terminal domain-containing protein, partial [Saprospiraceae bacterium]|nr:GMC family oxidoreductase N-terminal domain-containing protein [Saprospiraceae bacterium]